MIERGEKRKMKRQPRRKGKKNKNSSSACDVRSYRVDGSKEGISRKGNFHRGVGMSKFLTILIAGLFVFAAAAPASATDARVASLAYAGNYIEDDYNIFTWYATLPSYSNTVWIGMQPYYYEYGPSQGDEYFYYMGASYGLGEEGKYGTLAMFYYNNAPGLNPFGSYGSWPGAGVFGSWLPSKFTILYGYSMEKVSLGFYFNRADWMYKETVDEASEEDSYAYTTIGVGLRMDIGEKAYMDIAGDLSFASYKDEETSYGDVEQDANKMYGARMRLFYDWNDKITWVPYFNFRAFDFNLKAEEDWEFYGDKGLFLDFGLGANVKVNENNLLLFAIEPYSYVKREPSEPPSGVSYEEKSTVIPRFFLGLESDVKDWLTFRAGVMKELAKYEEDLEIEDVGKESNEQTNAPFEFYMGLGFHVGDFNIDCLLNNNLPFRLGYWLTGYQPYESYYDMPVYMITATYGF